MHIDRLPDATQGNPIQRSMSSFEDNVLKEHTKTKKVMKTFFNNAGILVGVFIVFAVVVIVTTDIHLASFADITSLGLDFFLLLFCSYSMHISCSDSGTRAGMNSKTFIESMREYEQNKRYLLENNLQQGLCDFCRMYVDDELKNSRMNVLAVVGFSYDQYVSNWMSADDSAIEESAELTEAQKRALLKANHIKPIRLTPEHIIRRGRNEGSRAPLGISPRTKKKIHFGAKFLTTLLVSLGIAVIALEVVKEPSWAIFASVVLKILTIVINGFSGYRFGYENVVIDTAEYVGDQTDLLKQAIKYIEHKSSIYTPCHEEGGKNVCVSETNESASAVSPRANTM